MMCRAEADEIVARKVNRQLQDEARRREAVRELEDEVHFQSVTLLQAFLLSCLVASS